MLSHRSPESGRRCRLVIEGLMRHVSSHAQPIDTVPVRQLRPVIESTPSPVRTADAPLALATLFGADLTDDVMRAVRGLLEHVGAPIDVCRISPALASTGTVGRIGVPYEAVALMRRQRVMVGASFGTCPLEPVSRLWRGLQRRADVVLDVRQCSTMPGSAAAHHGVDRDVLLVAHRVLERAAGPARNTSSADQWTRARHAAEIVYRLAASEDRPVLLVLPVGRGTPAQRMFSDALERQATLQRAQAPRCVKAGLLSALLSSDGGAERWLVASVMRMEGLSTLTTEAIGDTGPWPVMSLGRDVTFYDMPTSVRDSGDVLPMLLVLVSALHRSGSATLARALMQALLTTAAAAARMREELGTELIVPHHAFVRGVLANWGRVPFEVPTERSISQRVAFAPPARSPSPPDVRSAVRPKWRRTAA
jgi:hypothetical protein